MPKIKSFDGIRVFTTVAVFLYHTGLMPYIASEAVSVFFLLSGFLSYYTLQKSDNIGVGKGTITYIKKKFLAFFPVNFAGYLVFCLLFIYSCICGKTIFDVKDFLIKSILNLGFMQTLFKDYSVILNEPSWYLSTLMICFLFAYIIYIFIKKCSSTKYLFCAWMGIIILLWIINSASYFDGAYIYTNPLYRILEFICGNLIARIHVNIKVNDLELKVKKASIFEGILLGIIVIEWLIKFIFPEINENYAYSIFPLSVFLLIVSLGKGVISKFLSMPFLGRIAPYTLEFYILHETVFRFMYETFRLNGNWFINGLLYSIFSFIVLIPMTYLLHIFVQKNKQQSKY